MSIGVHFFYNISFVTFTLTNSKNTPFQGRIQIFAVSRLLDNDLLHGFAFKLPSLK